MSKFWKENSRARRKTRDEWLGFVEKYARDGNAAGALRCAKQACRVHARAFVYRVKP